MIFVLLKLWFSIHCFLSPFVFILAVLPCVDSGCACVDFGLSLYLFGLICTNYLVRIIYGVVTSVTIRLHQSNQAYSTTCLAFLLCKYQVPYFIPCFNLQNMIMYFQYRFCCIQRFDVSGDNEKKSKLWWPLIHSISTQRTNTPRKPTTNFFFCNNLHRVHSKSN